MSIYQIIESDHTLASHLITRIGASRCPDWRQRLCADLLQVLQVHAKAKRIAVYNSLRDQASLRSLIERLEEEQDITETYLKEALGVASDSPAFSRLFAEARAEFEQAIKLETQKIFPLARTIVDEHTAVRLGQYMRLLKDDFIQADYMGNLSLRADAGYYA